MLNAQMPTLGWRDVREELPQPGNLVLLRTKEYQFAGYLDEQLIWHWLSGRIEPNPVYCWLAPATETESSPALRE